MSDFHYVDIFATKGIEYLIIIGYLLLFIVFMRALNSNGGADKEDHDA